MTLLGHDFLGLGSPSWSVDQTIQALRPGSMIGCFDGAWPNAFGDPRNAIKRLCSSGKVTAVRVQIWWSYQHVGVTPDLLRKRVPLFEALAKQFPSVQFYISPSCEYQNVSQQLVQSWIDIIRNLAPSCVPVLSPGMGGVVVPGVIVEEHGTRATTSGALQSASTDGNGLADIDSNHWAQQANTGLYTLAWHYRYNMSVSGNTDTPNHRTHGPDAHYIQAIERLLHPIGSKPDHTFSGNPHPFAAPNLYKVMSEDNGSDPRRNMPCLITTQKADHCDLLDCHGRVVHSMPLYGPFLDNRWRYYGSMYGYQIAQRALAQSGSEFIFPRLGSFLFDGINPAFRTPTFL